MPANFSCDNVFVLFLPALIGVAAVGFVRLAPPIEVTFAQSDWQTLCPTIADAPAGQAALDMPRLNGIWSGDSSGGDKERKLPREKDRRTT